MKITTKLIALLLAMVLCLGSLVSCDQILSQLGQAGGNNQVGDNNQNGNTPGGGEEKPDENKVDGCLITNSFTYICDDEDMKAVIEAMTSGSTVELEGDKIRVQSSATVGETTVENSYVLIDGILYNRDYIDSEKYDLETLKKAEFGSGDRDALIKSVGAAVFVDISDFETCDMKKNNIGFVYECSDITAEAAESLKKILRARFAVLGGNVLVDTAELVMQTKDGKTLDYTLTLNLIVITDADSYEITLTQNTEYSYDGVTPITSPENADEYTLVDYTEILK